MPGSNRLTYKELIYFGVFFILVLACFGRLLFTDLTFYGRDISQYYRPMYFLTMESIQRGIFPFWNPYISCGQPFFAALQHGLLYPVSALGFLFPFEGAFKCVFVFHFVFAGLGIYLLLRQLDLQPGASLAGAGILVFSGVMASVINLMTTLIAASWLSYVFSFFLAARSRESKLPWIMLLALACSMQFYAGQPEVMYMSVLAITVFGLVAASRLAEYLDLGKILLLALCFIILLALIELVPFLQFLKLSHRESFSSWSAQTVWSLPPWQLLDLAIPSFLQSRLGEGTPLGQEWLKNIYFGIGGIFLIFFGYGNRTLRRSWWAFSGVALFSILVSFGSYTYFYKFITMVAPGLKAIRYPVKFLVIGNWCLAVLAAFGMHCICRGINQGSTEKSHLVKKLGVVYALFALTIFLCGQWYAWPARYLLLAIFTVVVLLLVVLQYVQAGRIYLVLASAIAIFVSSFYFTWGAEKLASVSNMRHQGEFKRSIDTLGLARFAFTPKTYAVITGAAPDASDYMDIYKVEDLSLWESVPNMAMTGHEYIAKGYESIYLDRFFSFYGLTSFQKSPSASNILDLLGVKYIVSLWDIKDSNLSLVKENGWKIYQNQRVWPRVFTTGSNVKSNTLGEAIRQLQGGYDGQTVPKIKAYDPHNIVLEAESPTLANLVLTDTYYPGWQATIDGQATVIFPAYYMMRGVSVPAGKHTIVFSYLPDNFRWAALVTAGTCLFFILYFICRVKTMMTGI